MSQFDAELKQAKSKQRMVFIVMFTSIVFGIFLIFSIFLFSRGIRVEISPEEAGQVAKINVHDGLAFYLHSTVYSISKKSTISISAPGFKPKTELLNFGGSIKVLPIELIALPGRLYVTTVPSSNKTKWFLDDTNLGVYEELDYQVDAGDHKLVIDNVFFERKEINFEIERDKELELSIPLEPVNRQIEIKSRPSGATIIFDDEKIGNTPLTIEKSGGKYDVIVALNNYLDISDEIEITRTVDLVKRNYLFEAKKAKINLSLTPKDGLLFLSGIKINSKKTLIVDANTEYELTYQKEGYFSDNKKIKLASNEKLNITFDLREELGMVDISSNPKALIFIDGKNMGETPAILTLPAIPHELVLIKSGYRSVKKIVQPSSKSTKKISEILLTELLARLKEAPKEYISKAGGKLKLFIVNEEFTLGANRDEPGQRANEFIRKAKLTKPFYAGLYEITNEEFQKFKKGETTNPDHPATFIKWIEAAAFCNWLSNEEDLKPFYNISNDSLINFNFDADGYRLLSEAEWEWLARKSGKKTQTMFVWGDEKVIPSHAANLADESAKGKVRAYVPNYQDGFDTVAPVGSFHQEKSGLYDMAGNVSEWTHDFYSVVPSEKNSTKMDPLGPKQGQMHVVKGANWRSGTMTELRPAFREGLINGRDDLGFRIGRYLYEGEK